MSATEPAGNAHRIVGFGESIGLFFRNYFKFDGRSSRGAYWWFVLFNLIVSFVLGMIDGISFPSGDMQPLTMLYGVATLIPGFALSVRRLHDIGRSGWWLLIVLTVIGIVVLIFWTLQPGQRATNKYGEDVEQGR